MGDTQLCILCVTHLDFTMCDTQLCILCVTHLNFTMCDTQLCILCVTQLNFTGCNTELCILCVTQVNFTVSDIELYFVCDIAELHSVWFRTVFCVWHCWTSQCVIQNCVFCVWHNWTSQCVVQNCVFCVWHSWTSQCVIQNCVFCVCHRWTSQCVIQNCVFCVCHRWTSQCVIQNCILCVTQMNFTLSDIELYFVCDIQWIPSHCNLPGNEAADSLAKEGTTKEQVDRSTSYPEVKTILKAKQHSKWRHKHPRYNKADPYYLLTRREQVTVFRLRTGHNRLNYHLYSKLRIGHTEQCPCGTGSQTTEHLLQFCPTYEPLRKGIWPDHTPLARKLYGSLRDLRCTATFIGETGISIWRTRRRRRSVWHSWTSHCLI